MFVLAVFRLTQAVFWSHCDVEMKIDEKNVLTYYESTSSPVDKEGYLYKKVSLKCI